MTPKDKAQDIFVKMMEYTPDHIVLDNKDASEICKIHCLIACDEIIETCKYNPQFRDFWEQVKEEIKSIL